MQSVRFLPLPSRSSSLIGTTLSIPMPAIEPHADRTELNFGPVLFEDHAVIVVSLWVDDFA
jgi:hypothetical protein